MGRRSTRTTATRAPRARLRPDRPPRCAASAVRLGGKRLVFVNSHERPVPRPGAAELRPPGLRGHRGHAAAHVPDPHQAVLPAAEDRRTSSTGRRTCGWAFPSRTPACMARIDDLRAVPARSGSCPASRCSARWPGWTFPASDGLSRAGSQGPATVLCTRPGSPRSGICAPHRMCRFSSSSGAGGRRRPADASSTGVSGTSSRN